MKPHLEKRHRVPGVTTVAARAEECLGQPGRALNRVAARPQPAERRGEAPSLSTGRMMVDHALSKNVANTALIIWNAKQRFLFTSALIKPRPHQAEVGGGGGGGVGKGGVVRYRIVKVCVCPASCARVIVIRHAHGPASAMQSRFLPRIFSPLARCGAQHGWHTKDGL